jgi:putative transposase
LTCSGEPDPCLEENRRRGCVIAICSEHGRTLWGVGGGRGTTGVAVCQDRRIDGGAGFFSEKVWCLSLAARLSLVERSEPDLPIATQCRLLKVARSTLYYRPLPVSVDDLRLMRWLDEQFLKTPFYGARRIVAVMRRDGFVVNRKRVKRLMRVMGIEAIYQKPNTSLGHPAHKVYPYLLRGLLIDRPNQVWCADITYVPMAKGFVYMVAVMDWFSRRVLSWRVSITMDSDFCVAALREAMEAHGRPEIFKTIAA